ncbi:hypothetical protein BC830DRAFT_409902 [Chytriomyces sp. MP71]|nr:hypothetical protein BC830DRAFT_409902 [Chytriomyces sp. MP71]
MNADGEDDSDSSDDDSDDENGDITSLDYSRLPLPNGEAPMDSQFYHNLDLPELRLDILPPNSKTPNPPPPRPIASAHPVPLQSTIPMGYPPLFPPAPMGMPPLGFPLAAPPGFPPTFPPPPFFPPHMPPPPIPAGMPPAFPPAMPPYIPPPHSHYHPYPPPHARQRPPPPPPPRRYQHHHDAAGNAPQFNVRAEIARNLSLPPKPAVAVGVGPMSSGPVVISAEPQMRDLQKELTQFVPSRVLKKRGASGAGVAAGAGPVKAIRSGGKLVVNAAPDVGDIGDAEEETNLGRINRGPETIATPVQDDEEYSAFMKEIGS